MKKIVSIILSVVLTTTILCACTKTSSQKAPASSNSNVSSQTQSKPNESTGKIDLPRSDKFKVADGKVTFTDKLERQVTIPIHPKKAVFLEYNSLDLWYHTGGTAVGRTDHILVDSRSDDEIGAKVKDVAVINGAHDPVNMELLIEKEPDLIVISPKTKSHLDAAISFDKYEIPYFAWNYDNFDGFLETLELFCIINDRMDLYEQYATDNITRINAVKEKIKDQEPISMVMLLPSAQKGAMALVNRGYLGNICNDLNTVNIAFKNEESPKSGPISMEKLIELDPNYIFSRGGTGDGSAENAKAIYEKSPLWKELTAIKEGRFDHLPAELFLYQANTRYAEAYEYMAKLLYPDLFK